MELNPKWALKGHFQIIFKYVQVLIENQQVFFTEKSKGICMQLIRDIFNIFPIYHLVCAFLIILQ